MREVVGNVRAVVPPRSSSTARGVMQQGAAELAEAGIESAMLDAEVLLRCALDLNQAELYLRFEDSLSARAQEKFFTLLERRAAREPLAYITRCKEFWSLEFMVTPAVLVPRPETELLVELALDWVRRSAPDQRIDILDIGTGSGAIAITLAKHLANSKVWALDVSGAALEIARANAKRHAVEDRVCLLGGDLFAALERESQTFDLIVSNPPYIRTADLAQLAPEIRLWEPLAALDGGADGLDFYRRIIPEAPAHLNENGRILLEIGADQADRVTGLFAQEQCYTRQEVHRDSAARNRTVSALKSARCG